jgi:hypothetical protein
MPRAKEVEAWLARYDNPMKPVVLRIREIILDADRRVEECIKWQAPITFEGNLASFYPKSKQHASLMFHQGAKIPGDHPRLEGSGDTSRVLKIASVAEADSAKKDLQRIVRAWCDWRSGDSAKPARTSAANKASAAKKKPVAKKKPPAKKKARRPAPRRVQPSV